MSRGPGTAQRKILDAVAEHGVVYLASLTSDMQTEYKSLYRAACRLAEAGKIGIVNYRFGAQKVVIHRPDVDASTQVRAVPHGGIMEALPFDRRALSQLHDYLRDQG